jgi:hypothetical protein
LLNTVRVERLLNQNLARTGENSLLLNGITGNSYFTLSKLIPVVANEQVHIQTYVTYSRKPRKFGNVLPMLGAGAIYSQQQKSNAVSEARALATSRRTFPYVGAGIALTLRGRKQQRGLPKAYLQYIVYDADTAFVRAGMKSIDRSARDHWQDLTMLMTVPKDGFLQVVFINESKQQVRADDFSVQITEGLYDFKVKGAFPVLGKKKATPYKGSLADHLNLTSSGGCVEVCGHRERTFLYSSGGYNWYQVCTYTIDCATGYPLSGRDCYEETEPTTGGGDPPPGGGGNNPPGGGNPCEGTAYKDDCGVCIGGNTGLTGQIWYRDADEDGWGLRQYARICVYPGPGWALDAGDTNDECHSTNNDPNQCICVPPPTLTDIVRGNHSIPLRAHEMGLTWPEHAYLTIGACRDGNTWRAVLLNLRGEYSLQTRLLPQIHEVTGPTGNTNLYNFCSQIRDLKAGSLETIFWFMLDAVTAHEEVHLAHFLPDLLNIESRVKLSVESHTIPYTGQSKAAATLQLNQMFGQAENDAAYRLWFNTLNQNVGPDHDDGSGEGTGTAYHVEQAVMSPMIQSICNQFSCGTCPH